MASHRRRDRCRERIERLVRSTVDPESVQREVVRQLQLTVGFDRWCWPSADPETLVPGGGLALHDYGPALPRALELEFSGADFAAKDVLARRGRSSSLDVETSGDLGRSPRWDEVLRPVGIGDVAAAACRDASGTWGWIEVYRDASDRPFGPDDVDLLGTVGRLVAGTLRRQVAQAPAASGIPSPAPGVMVLDRELAPVGRTASASAWAAALPGAGLFAQWGMLHPVVYPVATRARAGLPGAHALLPAVDGTWVRVDAAVLDGSAGEVAVTLRAASPAERFDLVSRARALSARERQVVGLLLAGCDTAGIAARLFITPATVQDHFKSVFAKLGVHSRTELLTELGGWASSSEPSPASGER